MVGVNDREEPMEEADVVNGVDEIGIAVLDIEIEAEVDKDVVGIAVIVVIEDIAVVVSGVDATDIEAGVEVEPPNVHSDPSGIYPKKKD